jgi:hypothetical protein
MGILLTFCPGWPQTTIFPISTSPVAGIAAMRHSAQLQNIFNFIKIKSQHQNWGVATKAVEISNVNA